jgi:RNA polymerase sigma-70 factor (ECF subfamily)
MIFFSPPRGFRTRPELQGPRDGASADGFFGEPSRGTASKMKDQGLASRSCGQATRTEPAGDLVSRVIAGDGEAFRSIVEIHEPSVFGLARRLLGGDRSEAEDVTQETFVRAFQYLRSLEDRERFQPWLHAIARSLCLERRRRRQAEGRALARREEIQRRESICGSPGRDRVIASALDDLPLDERRILGLRYYEGLSYDEISIRLQLSFAQVDHLIRKARSRLARRLEVRERLEN